MMDFEGLKRTPLFERHIALGARMVDFGGWALPVQYAGILQEHQAVRERVGLFDVSHMGEIGISGPGAEEFVSYLVTNTVRGMDIGKVVYSPMCNEQGGTVDDLLIYRRKDDFMLVVNAANQQKDFAWIASRALQGVEVVDESEQTALLALQGPQAMEMLLRFAPEAGTLAPFTFGEYTLQGYKCLISRTGYTAEDGVEIYVRPEGATPIWDALIAAGAEPCGLGARDTLRFEGGMPLYGHEMDEQISPLTAGLGMFVKIGKEGGFIGEAALAEEKAQGRGSRRIGLRMIERGIPREGYPVQDAEGNEIGVITSGTMSPTRKENLAMARITGRLPEMSEQVSVLVRGKALKAERVKLPFYKRSISK